MKTESEYQKAIQSIDWVNKELNKIIIAINGHIDTVEFLEKSIENINNNAHVKDARKKVGVDDINSFVSYAEVAKLRVQAQLRKTNDIKDAILRKAEPKYDDYLDVLEKQLRNWNVEAGNEQ